MKRLLLVLIGVIAVQILCAQAPNLINYQGVARLSDGTPIEDQIAVQFTIRGGSTSGTILYQEFHQVTPNVNGLFALQIGIGESVIGDFTSVDWADGAKFLEVGIDPEGGTNYALFTITQLVSVPYALHAGSTDTANAAIVAYDNMNSELLATNAQAAIDELDDVLDAGDLTDDQTATDVNYDNTTSDFSAVNVQAAIDELDGVLDAGDLTDDQTATDVNYDNTTSDLSAVNVQVAIDELDGVLDAGDLTDDQTATDVNYDNTTSDLSAVNVQAAIDELDGLLDTGDLTDDQTATDVNYDNTTSGLSAVNAQTAIDELDGVLDAGDLTDDQTATDVSYDNETSGLSATNTQTAIDELGQDLANSVVHLDTDGNVEISNGDMNVNGTITADSLAIQGQYGFPTVDGQSDQALVTNGNGTVSWVDLGPYAGVNTDSQVAAQVPYDNTGTDIAGTDVQAALTELDLNLTTNAWSLSGNMVGALGTFGTTDDNSIAIVTNNTEIVRLDADGDVGIGVNDPGHTLHVEGQTANSSGFDGLTSILGSTYEVGNLQTYTEGDAANHNNVGAAFLMNGSGTGINYGVLGLAMDVAENNRGVFAVASGASISNRGLNGNAYGTGTSTQSIGAQGYGTESNNNYGVRGIAVGTGTSALSIGVSGSADGSLDNWGLTGSATGVSDNSNVGTRGVAQNSSNGRNIGIYGAGTGDGTENWGGEFFASGAASNEAVRAISASTTGDNYGLNTDANGVTSGTNYGIYAAASNATTANYAGYFVGDMLVTSGSISGVVDYDNSSSGLTATNTQAAIDEVHGNFSNMIKTTGLNEANLNTYVGFDSGIGAPNISYRNTGLGEGTLQSQTEGSDNLAAGYGALNSLTTSIWNTALGSFALNNLIDGSGNVGVGAEVLESITTASFNVAVGFRAMENAISGDMNIAIGREAFGFSSTPEGANNITIGSRSMAGVTTGSDNVTIGYSAGGDVTDGNSNILIGPWSNVVGSISNGVAIGSSATVAQNDAIILGNAANTNVRVGIGTNAPAEKLDVVGNAIISGDLTAGGVMLASDLRFKKNVRILDDAFAKLKQVRGTSYYWKDASRGEDLQYGVIAQEVERVFPELVATNENGMKTVNYIGLIPVLIEAIKEQQLQIATLEIQLAERKQPGKRSTLVSKDDLEAMRLRLDRLERIISAEANRE